jgi:ribosomal protein S18 acetylase RimI-like enzyme
MIQDVTPSLLPEVRAFLESHLHTSIFLLHCLERFGPRLGEHRDSGNYRCVREGGPVVAVASATRRGHLLLQTGGRRDLAAEVLRGCAADPVRIDGVVAEWHAADSTWALLRGREGFRPTYEVQHVVFYLASDTAPATPPPPRQALVRPLVREDFDAWYPLFHALEVEEGASLQGDRDEVRRRFSTAPWRWWGAFVTGELAAAACVDAAYRDAAHIGGVYVRPAYRGQGIARVLLMTMLEEERAAGRLTRPVVHARMSNLPAQRLYETIGFAPAGHFAFLFGEWPGLEHPAARPA